MLWLVIFVVGLVAGFVDAIAGGGGLIMLPGLLFTGLPVGSAIATNKLCGTCGAITSTLKFAHAKQIDWPACKLMALPVIFGAYIGSRSIDRLPSAWAEPTVVVLISAITLLVIFKPSLGKSGRTITHSKPTTPKTIFSLVLSGTVIGFHDGFFGPGTGIFLVFALLSLLPLDFLKATGSTKLLNLLTNITALTIFAMAGNIDYSRGIAGAVGVAIGSFIGATFAAKKGEKIIKPIFVFVAITLIAKMLLS